VCINEVRRTAVVYTGSQVATNGHELAVGVDTNRLFTEFGVLG
jgi:hypothetical protein